MRRQLHHGKNWYSAMGILFAVVGTISLVESSLIWSPGFVVDFILSPEINKEKVSTGMVCFGLFLIAVGFKRKSYDQP